MSGKRRRNIIIAAAVIILAAAAAAGICLYLNRFDPEAYVQAVLDVAYKKETEEYEEITGASKQEAEAVFEENLDATMEEFESSPMPEELRPQYRELFGEIAMQVSYTVGEAHREDDGSYAVPVTVKPLTLFSDTYDTFQQKAKEYADQVTDSVMQGEAMPSDDEMQSEVYQIYYDVLREGVDSGLLYGEARNVTLHIAKNADGEYEINAEDMKALDSLLIEEEGDAQAEESDRQDSVAGASVGSGTESAEMTQTER